jgi:hypothetical protein
MRKRAIDTESEASTSTPLKRNSSRRVPAKKRTVDETESTPSKPPQTTRKRNKAAPVEIEVVEEGDERSSEQEGTQNGDERSVKQENAQASRQNSHYSTLSIEPDIKLENRRSVSRRSTER